MHSPLLPALKLSFDAVFYYVTDLDRSVDFYRNVLDFPLVSRDFVARFDIDGVLFELVPADGERRVSGSCLQVQDIHESVAQMKARGVQTSNIKAVTGGLLAFFNDLDGNELCLWQYTDRAK
jgi:catechol 2,3-dioxygenase-like lactoylglutathione lyase family enzyme